MTRSLIAILTFLSLPWVLEAQEQSKTEIREAPLDAQDMGVYKYAFEASPPADSVMVFRWTESNGDYVYDVSESVSYTGGKSAQEVIRIYDPARFPFRDRQNEQPTSVTYTALRAAGELTHMHMGQISISNHRKATFQFKGENDRTKTFVFECFVESYAAAKARIPDLPEITADQPEWKYYPTLDRKTLRAIAHADAR